MNYDFTRTVFFLKRSDGALKIFSMLNHIFWEIHCKEFKSETQVGISYFTFWLSFITLFKYRSKYVARKYEPKTYKDNDYNNIMNGTV